MVGLSIVLEAQKASSSVSKKSPQVISKTATILNKHSSSSSSSSSSTVVASPSSCKSSQPSSFPSTAFLDQCFLCGQKLLPGKDIYMYKGDRAFCSVECRCKQIFMDEEESVRNENCSMAAMKPSATPSSSSSTSSSSSSSASAGRHHRKGARTRAGGFAY